MKSSSFTPTLSNIIWCEIRKDFTKFINNVRRRAKAEQQQQQQHQLQQIQINCEINTEEPTKNENNFTPGQPLLKVNPQQQLYHSKTSETTACTEHKN